MGHNISRSARGAREFSYSYAVWLIDRRSKARQQIKEACTAAARTAAEGRLSAIEDVITLGRTVGIDAQHPGPHGKVSGSAFSLLLFLGDVADEDLHGTQRAPGGTRILRRPVTVRRMAGAMGRVEGTARTAYTALTDAKYIDLTQATQTGAMCRVTDPVTGWWARVEASGFKEAVARVRLTGDARYESDDLPEDPFAEQGDEPEEPVTEPAAPAKPAAPAPSNVVDLPAVPALVADEDRAAIAAARRERLIA